MQLFVKARIIYLLFLQKRWNTAVSPVAIAERLDVPEPIIKTITKQLYLTRIEFEQLVSCRISANTYYEIRDTREIDPIPPKTIETSSSPIVINRQIIYHPQLIANIDSSIISASLFLAAHCLTDDLLDYVGQPRVSRLPQIWP